MTTSDATQTKSTTKFLVGDLVCGLLAAIIALPLALAFGVASGLVGVSDGIRSVLEGVGIPLSSSNSFVTVEEALADLSSRAWQEPEGVD